MKKVLAILLVLALVLSLGACGKEKVDTPDKTGYEVTVLIKATDSTFWNKVGEGAKKFGDEHSDVTVTVQGPTSESDIEKSLSLLENAILSKPDAIVIGSNAGEGASAAIAEATEAGIKVITIDTALPSKNVVCHLATDNIKGGELAAEAMVKYMKDNNKPLEGKVAIIAAVAGVQTIIDRDGGFIDKMKEIAPNIEVLSPEYVDNDIEKSMSAAENLMLTYGDELVGIYADNNHTGDGVARAIEQAKKQDSITVVAFDDDKEELDALRDGVIRALIIQDQQNMGYSGVEYAIKAVKGELNTDYVDTGVMVTWPEDLK